MCSIDHKGNLFYLRKESQGIRETCLGLQDMVRNGPNKEEGTAEGLHCHYHKSTVSAGQNGSSRNDGAVEMQPPSSSPALHYTGP